MMIAAVTLSVLTISHFAAAQTPGVSSPSTAPATQPTIEEDGSRDRDRDRVLTLAETLVRFELDARLSLCHVWEAKNGSGLVGFVEHPQYIAALGSATKQDVSKIKLLPEASKTAARFGIVAVDHVLLREDPVDRPGDRDNVSDLLLGEPVWILDQSSNGWYLVHSSDGYLGWVESSNIESIGAAAMKTALTRTRASEGERRVRDVLDIAESVLGTPYVWGGKTAAGIDCSGLSQTSFARLGVFLPRDADQQAHVGKLVATRWFKDALLPGDLLFFISEHRGNVHHIAIYLGEGKYIHASGKDVHIGSFNEADAEFDAGRARTFAFARRVIE